MRSGNPNPSSPHDHKKQEFCERVGVDLKIHFSVGRCGYFFFMCVQWLWMYAVCVDVSEITIVIEQMLILSTRFVFLSSGNSLLIFLHLPSSLASKLNIITMLFTIILNY